MNDQHNSAPPDTSHFLLTALGVRAQDATYELDGHTETAPLTPLALMRLLPAGRRPNQVVAVVTEQAKRDTWPLFAQSIGKLDGVNQTEPVEIPDGRSPVELREILERVADRFPSDCQLTLDVTQGLRHFPFVVYALALYLTSLKGVRLRGAYYGMFEGIPPDQPHPIIDLRLLLELPEWFHAVRVFRDQGIAAPIARLIQPVVARLREKAQAQSNDPELHQQASVLKRATTDLERHSFAYATGLPLELGKAARAVADSVPSLTTSELGRALPLVASLVEIVARAAKISAFCQTPPAKGKWKVFVELNAQELERQARLIDAYLERDQVSLAAGLLREWVISWAMWRSGYTKAWLGATARKPFERRLGALGAFAREPGLNIELNESQRDFANFWNRLTDELRNALLHHGMRPESIEEPLACLPAVRGFWNRIRRGEVDLPELGGGKGRLLISPQGNRSGVLFSAIRTLQQEGRPPDRCLVICSSQSTETVEEAARQTGCEAPRQCLVLEDPFGGFGEIDRLTTDARRWLLEADAVLANLTGGTTLMGIVVQRLVEQTQRLDRPVRRFVLIDRRRPAEQDTEPFVQSEYHWLDAASQMEKTHAHD